MTPRMLDALGAVVGYLVIASAVFPAAVFRIGWQLSLDFRTVFDNRKART